ncbi:hypothetical protein C2G38_623995 [Gigaspora rosea]|uniref:Peptidase S1 domain-containing protein n=1 Tax=Gigaspora rosea TaxID=44941 RepID=A0A397U623_9GLOM|nr:hypothetical protein C2G38_623995 [Gigaspora rosea]
MMNIQNLMKLLLFLSIFICQNYLTVQITRIESLKPLAEHWNVSLNDVPNLLTIEGILTNATIILTPLLYKYNDSFGGFYINVKANSLFINTIDFSKVSEIKSSPVLQEFIHLLNFKPANYSTYQLESIFNSLSELTDSTNPVNIVMGISPIYNRIVIDLSHNDDKVNEEFLNATLQFEHFIFLNYVDDSDDSLTLRSTFNSSSSRLHTKRLIELYFQGGEGIVTNNTNTSQPVLSCLAGFSAIDVSTLQEYLITSARCLPPDPQNISIYHAPWLPPFPHYDEYEFFGIVREFKYAVIDFALIEKFNDHFKLNPMIRSSVDEFPSSIISAFNINGVPIPVGHHLCISGYESYTSCGDVATVDTSVMLRPLRQRVLSDTYRKMIKANIPCSSKDVGGTVFGNENHNGTLFTLVHGILTATLSTYRTPGNAVIQPLASMINNNPTRHIFENLLYIDLDTYNQL